MALYSISLKQLSRSIWVPPLVALGAVCFSLYNPLHTSYLESDRLENVFVGFICTIGEILAVWALARCWHYWYRLITRTGSIWRTSFTRAFYALWGIIVLLASFPYIYEREVQVLPKLNYLYAGSGRTIVLIGVTAWIVIEVVIEVSILASAAATLLLGPAALWFNRKTIRFWWVSRCRCRGTCRYPRVPS